MVTLYARHQHYADHMAPVAALVGDLDVALAASYPDMRDARKAGHERIVLMQHGTGQSYSDDNPHYPGGRDNEGVGLFIVPNIHAGQRWQAAYPAARVEVVGSPRLDGLPSREAGPVTVAVSFHWDAYHTPEARSAFAFYQLALRSLAERFHVIGHCHPRRSDVPRWYAKLGIEYVPTFEEVCRRASVYVADNTSTLFEFAATGRPVVVLNAPWYRRDVNHGLRFYEASHVGINVDQAEDLPAAIEEALEDAPARREAREAALDIAYRYRTGAAERATDAIRDWAA